ncbi:MAG: 3-dehydroquinate synthase [Thermomicrobiales bacterium]|nr:3-dehydroquinate synthase [Thermomicrobiales bacterium]
MRRLVLVGLSGVGKSTAGALAAERLGWRFVDTDAALEADAGMPVPEMFRCYGEAAFRQAERAMLARALADDDVVVATGGGAVVDAAVWAEDLLTRPGTLVAALDADPAVSLERLRAQQAAEGETAERPLLVGGDPLGRLQAMKAQRQSAYDRAAIALVVDRTPPSQVAAELARLVGPLADEPDVLLRAHSGESRVWIEPGGVGALGARIAARWPAARRVWVITDEHVGERHGATVVGVLAERGFDARLRAVPAGEGSKSVAGASDLYDWMLGEGAERSQVVVALGGGVVGDLAGFVAATTLRGLGLAQIPTSLLAMVDSSVGGKTGINHAAGKNLIGAFYQPPVVVIDPRFLTTLPPRELRSGWAEIVKHGVIQPSTPGGERADLARFLERNAERLSRLEEPALSYLIRRNVALKAAVVMEDEREAGIRAYLNFGHTLGHAIEAADYHLLHGEAIALGMRAASRIGEAMGTCDAATVARIDAALDRFGLPRATEVDAERALSLIGSDKKRADGRQRWVLPLAEGGVTIRDDVPANIVRAGLEAVRAPVPVG